SVASIAERIPAGYRVPAAWKARTGTYRATNINPRAYPGLSPPEARLALDHGLLIWSNLGSQVMVPDGSGRAFTFGISPFSALRGIGELLRARGNTLSTLGVTYRRTR